ncbi:hypothetical protein Hanom_Chr13g01216081 [Helianthus anomalus]
MCYFQANGWNRQRQRASRVLEPTRGSTKEKKIVSFGGSDLEEEEPPRAPKPKCASGSLLDQPIEWQAEVFHDQMNALTQCKEAFICEKEVRENDFGPFGITDKFKALGWEGTLKCYDGEGKNLYDAEIQKWIATQRCPRFKNPSKMKLTGKVNGIEVEMPYDTLRRVVKFDIKPATNTSTLVWRICISILKSIQDET